MALVFKVGENDEMLPVPKNFPTCNDYIPNVDSNESAEEELTTSIAANNLDNSLAATIRNTSTNLIFVYLLLSSLNILRLL